MDHTGDRSASLSGEQPPAGAGSRARAFQPPPPQGSPPYTDLLPRACLRVQAVQPAAVNNSLTSLTAVPIVPKDRPVACQRPPTENR